MLKMNVLGMNPRTALVACCLLSGGVPHIVVLGAVREAAVQREHSRRVVITWSASAPVDVYVSDRPDAQLRQARRVSRGDRDGRYLATVSDRRRSYFLLRDTVDGSVVRVAERVLPLEGGSNFRDVGGYPAAGGKHVRWGMIYRSGATPLLSDSDIAYIRTLGLSAMIDLRSTEERELVPTRLAGQGIRYVAVDYPLRTLLPADGPATAGASPPPPRNVYRDFPTVLAPEFRAVFQELLSQPKPIVYNCTAGQDRTGFATALILSALGVPRETIFEDYHLSTANRHPQNEMLPIDPAHYPGNPAAELFATARPAKPAPLYSADGRALLADSFDEIETRWGSVESYLQQVLGVGPTELAILRAHYLE